MNLHSLKCIKDYGFSLTKLQFLTACVVNFADEVISVPVGDKISDSTSQGIYLDNQVTTTQVCKS